jgi:SpoVK/Ycf46/Vps4 family AAA+-type ATPase
VLLVAVTTTETPRVSDEDRAAVTPVANGITRVELRFGFMEQPNVPQGLEVAMARGQIAKYDLSRLVDCPDRTGRREILKVHVAKVTLATNVDLDQIAGLTPGFTGADLANLVNEAAIVATRRNGGAVALDDFTVAADRIEASEATEREIDIAVRDIVVKAFERATEVLRASGRS